MKLTCPYANSFPQTFFEAALEGTKIARWENQGKIRTDVNCVKLVEFWFFEAGNAAEQAVPPPPSVLVHTVC
jgi:hypothetical protein